MVFASQRENIPETNAAIPINPRLRVPHHKFQAAARIEQRKEKQHDKYGACQPVPHQRKGADKQAEKGQRMLREVEQMLGNLFFITKISNARPSCTA